jgi:hypothetical protein
MPAPLILAGLSLLPKIPEMWDTVAGLFGKKAPKSVMEAGKIANDIMGSFQKDEVPPEVQLKLEAVLNEHKEKMARIALEEKEMDINLKKEELKEVESVRELEKESYKVDDEYVRRTRPKILRDLFVMCCGFSLFAPLCVIAIAIAGVEAAIVSSVVGMIEWIGGWLFGTFSTSFIGYTAARSVDKKNPDFKNGAGIMSKLTKLATK